MTMIDGVAAPSCRMRNTETTNKNWFELKNKIQTRWGKFTDSDLAGIDGNIDGLAVLVQRVYHYTPDQVRREVTAFVTSLCLTEGK